MLIILTGKTASGKDTILKLLLSKYPGFKKVITTTSRPPRAHEIEGKDYYFLTRGEFEQKIKMDEFIEHVDYGGNLYGTFKTELENSLNSDLIWKIDPSRAGVIREYIKDFFDPEKILVIYITTDDQTILQRLKERGLTQEEIDRRREDDEQFWQQFRNNYDFVVENIPGKLNETMDKIITILTLSF